MAPGLVPFVVLEKSALRNTQKKRVKFKHIPVTSGGIGSSGGGGNKGGNGNGNEVELHFDGLFWGGGVVCLEVLS